MKLTRATENVLTIMAPSWMKKLKKANWNKQKLSNRDSNVLSQNAQRCFIGEVHCMSEDYLSGNANPCNMCKEFCKTVPNRFQPYYNTKQKKQLLDDIADHIVEQHPTLLAKKVQLRAHKVFN